MYFLNLILEATTDRNVTSSICPAGWVLPLSGTIYDIVSGSFYNLLSKYNAASNNETSAGIIVQPPLSFVRSGNVDLSYGGVYVVGNQGYDWSRTAVSSTYAYGLGFYSSGVNPSNNYGRYNGFPLH